MLASVSARSSLSENEAMRLAVEETHAVRWGKSHHDRWAGSYQPGVSDRPARGEPAHRLLENRGRVLVTMGGAMSPLRSVRSA